MSAAEMLAGAAPERAPDWHSLEGKKVWRTVRRLRVRIVKAVQTTAASCEGRLRMLELHEGKLSRAVLRGGGGGNATSLPGLRLVVSSRSVMHYVKEVF